MRSLLASLTLVLVALAGCAEDAPPAEEDDDGFGLDDDLEATDETGVIRGVVVNPAIVPIPGVQVSVIGAQKTTTTDDNGFFGFSDLEPGAYFLEASRVGYVTAQTSTDVQAGVDKPPVVKIQLVPDPDSVPYAVTHVFEGFIQCGAGSSGGIALNPCYMSGSDNVRNHGVDKPATFVQSEMIWSSTSLAGDDLLIGYYDPDSLTGASDFKDASGPSPVLLQANQTEIEAALGIDYKNITVRVFPGISQPASATFDQRFTVYTTIFYGIMPEDDWRFSEDGEYVVPS